MDSSRRQQLLSLKLAALARDHLDLADGEPGPAKDGATLRAGERGAVLLETAQPGAIGGALAWARRRGIERLDVLVEAAADPGLVARRAALVGPTPEVAVWVVDGRELHPAHPAPPAEPPAAPDPVWVERLRAAGTEPVTEVGGLRGEVRGLAVALVEATGRLHVGVSVNDREAHDELHGGQPPAETVAGVAATVAARRTAEGDDHPWRRSETDRWLRAALCADPSLLGDDDIEGLAPWWWPASARSTDGATLVVCGSGLDLDFALSGADARLAAMAAPFDWPAAPRLVLAVADEADHPLVHELAATLAVPAEVAVIPDGWRSSAP